MHRVSSGLARRIDEGVDVQVAVDGLVGPDVDGLVGGADVARPAIAVGIDGHGGNAHLAARASDPDGNLAAVGDEDFHETSISGRM